MDHDQMELVAKGAHMAERMLTLREVSAYLNVNPATVRRLVRSGQLRAIRVGRDMRFEVRVVDQWVAAGGSLPGQSEPAIKVDSGPARKSIKY
jgi:excisionase family DNA binding protein